MADAPGPVPPLSPRPWHSGIARQYITLFLWVGFYDRLAGETLAVGGLAWSALGAAAAGLLCYVGLYFVPALWGLRARRGLVGVAEATFGRAGAAWVPGALMGLAQVGWFAVATFSVAEYTLGGLVACRLIEPGSLAPISWRGLTLGSPVFLASALFWTYALASLGIWAVRLVSALMIVYPGALAMLLASAMLWDLDGLPRFRPPGLDPATGEAVVDAGPRALQMMIQWVFAFFATAGAAAADWGAVSRDERDVRVGGLVGVAMAPTILVVLALATVAGALGRRPPSPVLEAEAHLDRALVMRGSGPVVERARRDLRAAREAAARDSTFASALVRGVGGRWAGAMLLGFALGALVPAVYSAFVLGDRLAASWPILPRPAWSLLGVTAAYPLVALGIPARAGPTFGVLGALFAPVVGAMAADALRHRGDWPGPRRGVNLAGLLAWAIGLAVGLVPILGPSLGRPHATRLQPASVYAFLVALVSYTFLASVGLESPRDPDPDPDRHPSSIS